MNIAKHTLIYFLIFAFLLISFFGNSIKPTKAAECTDAQNQEMATLTAKKNSSQPLSSTEDTRYSVLKIMGCVPTPSTAATTTSAAAWTPADAQESGVLQEKKNNGTITPVEQKRLDALTTKYNASWTAADAINYQRLKDKKAAGTTLTAADQKEFDRLTAKSTSLGGAGTAPVTFGGTTPPDDESCTKHCPGGTWWWKVDENIQNAICNMQCTIIDWESSMIGWVVSKVLYPALGLCVENDPSKPCPSLPESPESGTIPAPTP